MEAKRCWRVDFQRTHSWSWLPASHSLPLSLSPFHRHTNHPQLGRGTRRTRGDKDQTSLEGRDPSQGKTLKFPSGQSTWKLLRCSVSYKGLTNCGESHHKGLGFYGPKAGVTNSWRRQNCFLAARCAGPRKQGGQPSCLFLNPSLSLFFPLSLLLFLSSFLPYYHPFTNPRTCICIPSTCQEPCLDAMVTKTTCSLCPRGPCTFL